MKRRFLGILIIVVVLGILSWMIHFELSHSHGCHCDHQHVYHQDCCHGGIHHRHVHTCDHSHGIWHNITHLVIHVLICVFFCEILHNPMHRLMRFAKSCISGKPIKKENTCCKCEDKDVDN